MENTLYVVLGPTSVGKTELTLSLAERLGVPVINADSRQVFRELPIGTAAPTPEQQARARHYFVGNKSVTDYYSASLYEQDVISLLPQLFQKKPYALLSGGSMMYIDAVCRGIDDIPTVRDDIRTMMKQRLESEGLDRLVAELHELDPDHWAVVDRNNPRRVVHALEICHQTGRTYTSFRQGEKKHRPFNIVKIGLRREREELYSRINQRVVEMVRQGLVEECLTMLPYRHLNALNTVGYQELFPYLDGLMTLDESIFRIQSNTRRYARKQMTWWGRDPDIHWVHPDLPEAIAEWVP